MFTSILPIHLYINFNLKKGIIELFKMGLPYNISFKIKILQQKVHIHFVHNSNAPFEFFHIYIYIYMDGTNLSEFF
jgi:hypothetical protein